MTDPAPVMASGPNAAMSVDIASTEGPGNASGEPEAKRQCIDPKQSGRDDAAVETSKDAAAATTGVVAEATSKSVTAEDTAVSASKAAMDAVFASYAHEINRLADEFDQAVLDRDVCAAIAGGHTHILLVLNGDNRTSISQDITESVDEAYNTRPTSECCYEMAVSDMVVPFPETMIVDGSYECSRAVKAIKAIDDWSGGSRCENVDDEFQPESEYEESETEEENAENPDASPVIVTRRHKIECGCANWARDTHLPLKFALVTAPSSIRRMLKNQRLVLGSHWHMVYQAKGASILYNT